MSELLLGKEPPNQVLVTEKDAVPAPRSALRVPRVIEELGTVQYPEGIQSPNPELNKGAQKGKFRYNREFLLQFRNICTEKPVTHFPLDIFGLVPSARKPSSPTTSLHKSGCHDPQSPGAVPSSPQSKRSRTRSKRRKHSSKNGASLLLQQGDSVGSSVPGPS